jgi:hypothetical protein
MPGLYVVIPRAAGTLITELIYNFDHQQHVDGRSAESMAGYGVSGSQFQLTEDPYPGSVESLAPSLAGEITRYRFVLAQIIGEMSGGAPANWYDPINTPALPFIGARVARASTVAIPNNSVTVVSFSGGTVDFNSTVPAPVYDDMGQPTRFTAPVAGRYMAFCFATWAANSTGKRQINMGMNSFATIGPSQTNVAPTGNAQTQTITGIFNMAANDYVQFSAFQNSGGNLSFTAAGGLVYLGGD